MRKFLLTLFFTPIVLLLSAQTEPPIIDLSAPPKNEAPPKPWTNELQAGINLNQAAYSQNWTSGGVTSVAVSTFLNGKANRKWDRSEWENSLQLLYGNIRNKDEALKKNADRIFLESKYAFRLHKHLNAFGSLTFMSQFADGYEFYRNKDSAGVEVGAEQSRKISSFMAPAYLTEAIGLEYKPVNYFSAQFGLGAFRQTFVTNQSLYSISGNDSLVLYGVDKGQNMRNQVVFQFVANFDKEIMKNIFLKARYMTVVDYYNLKSEAIVQRLDASLTAKVNKYINVNISGVVLYDIDQDKDVQYSQVLSLGILYGINNQPKNK